MESPSIAKALAHMHASSDQTRIFSVADRLLIGQLSIAPELAESMAELAATAAGPK